MCVYLYLKSEMIFLFFVVLIVLFGVDWCSDFLDFIFVAPRGQRTVLYCWCLDSKVFVYFSLFIGVVIFFFCV